MKAVHWIVVAVGALGAAAAWAAPSLPTPWQGIAQAFSTAAQAVTVVLGLSSQKVGT